ncbi:uncharacterized protein LOC116133652 isoform X2 [Pistacia vera]|uniref:uncharacterized protein LOC116133652 isoform X2 n=1 Tax=Pistacia vera TaxID=55513 RepID=UPI001263758E|nr:uncharacterized protein LOC116133652 isoform X2 [Pistacia vera]
MPISLHAATPHQTPTNQPESSFPYLAKRRDASPDAAMPHQTPTNQRLTIISTPRQKLSRLTKPTEIVISTPRLAKCHDASPDAEKLQTKLSSFPHLARSRHASPVENRRHKIPEAAHFKALGSTVEEAFMDLVVVPSQWNYLLVFWKLF